MKTKINRTSLGLRELLFDELDSLRDGSSNPQRASAIAKTAAQIINTVRIELDHARYVTSIGKNVESHQVRPLELGHT